MAYRVRTQGFTYQGRAYQIGEIWVPVGHANDAAIIRARLVVEAPLEEAASEVDLSPRRVARGKVRT